MFRSIYNLMDNLRAEKIEFSEALRQLYEISPLVSFATFKKRKPTPILESNSPKHPRFL